jgi:hypothetical protein
MDRGSGSIRDSEHETIVVLDADALLREEHNTSRFGVVEDDLDLSGRRLVLNDNNDSLVEGSRRQNIASELNLSRADRMVEVTEVLCKRSGE